MDNTVANSQPAIQQPRKRWLQFGTRSMLVWVGVIGLLLALVMPWIGPAQRQRVAVQMIQRAGGQVIYANPTMPESWLKTQLRDWLPRDYLDTVEWVTLSSTSVTDADLARLRPLKDVRVLFLGGTAITDEGLEHLSGLTQLQSLSLSRTEITDSGLARVSGLSQLHTLYLHRNQITDNGLLHLNNLKQLESLHLGGTPITDAGLPNLISLGNLQTLRLDGTLTTKAGRQQLQQTLPACNIVPHSSE